MNSLRLSWIYSNDKTAEAMMPHRMLNLKARCSYLTHHASAFHGRIDFQDPIAAGCSKRLQKAVLHTSAVFNKKIKVSHDPIIGLQKVGVLLTKRSLATGISRLHALYLKKFLKGIEGQSHSALIKKPFITSSAVR